MANRLVIYSRDHDSNVLDTNTASFVMHGVESVVRRLTAQARTDVLLPQPVVAEIEYGLARLPRSARRTPWLSGPRW